MESLDAAAVRQFLDRAGIRAADPDAGIGRELTYRDSPRRTIVVYVGENISREHVSRIVSVILSSEESWLLIARYGSPSMLGLASVSPEADALVFRAAEVRDLTAYVCTRDMSLGSARADLYLVSGSGTVLVTWDHHTSEDGLEIQLRNVDETGALLTKLNAVGAELELFYNDADT
jgi:hypothetical protein